MQGVVSKVSSFDYNGKTLWSFQLNGDRSFYRTGDKRPTVEQGQFISFDAKQGGKQGNFNVDLNSITIKKEEQQAKGVVGAFTNGASNKDDYWTKKEARDVLVQARIERQSTRNSALEFIKILIQQEAVKVPAKNKVEFFEQLLGHYQEEFIADNSGESMAKAAQQASDDSNNDDKVPY